MRFLKKLLGLLLALTGAAAVIAAISLTVQGEGAEKVFSLAGMEVTVPGIGAGLSLLAALLFAWFRLADIRKRSDAASGWGERLNAAGFGLLPGAAVWKIFEQATALSRGRTVPESLPAIPLLTAEGRYSPSRIDLILAVLCFFAVLLWLILRKNDFPGNGDLFVTVLCAWSLIRALTEGFREEPLISAGTVNITQILFFAAAAACFAAWTARLYRTQKSTAFTVLEWIAVLGCGTAIALNTCDTLTTGSGVGDLAVNAACTALCALLMLPAGRDSRN